ncbi:MAG: septum formation initiator family protein [Paludibacteraceae bacterium]|nr:septum formation initiator family protein [Paludibacteraceae bacterium]
MNIKELWNKRPSWVNKYSITLLAFFIYIGFIDDSSLWKRFELYRKQKRVNDDIQFYEDRITTTQQNISDLSKNDSTLERYAREQYLMHATDEEVFIIEEPE